MQLNDYQQAAVSTAIYPRKYAVVYPSLGLIGELNELMDAVIDGEMDRIIKEAGDTCWYIANLSNDIGLEMSDITRKPSTPLPSVKNIGVFCEKVKKYVRDGAEEKRADIVEFISDALSAVITVCHDHCIPFDLVLSTNIAKLQSRKERGTLTGDGDNR